MIKRQHILFFLLTLSILGCKKGDLGDVKDYLVGTWKIYSISTASHSGSSAVYPQKGDKEYQELTFKDNGRFEVCQKGFNEWGRITQVYDTVRFSNHVSFDIIFSAKEHPNTVFGSRYYAQYHYQPEDLWINANGTYYFYNKK